MPAPSNPHPPLRLVSGEPAPEVVRPVAAAGRPRPDGDAGTAGGVALSASDARWVLAVRVAASLQGGRAAILTPTLRHKLVARAVASGLREFDANLIIAIVQDAARTTGAPLARDVADRLRYVRGPRPRSGSIVVPVLSSAVIAMVVFVVLVGWVLGG